MTDFAEAASAIRVSLADDPHRPQYHFLPPSNWMNDPNGVIQWGDKFHLFYQHNPNRAIWGDMHWGHAVSTDLVHWEDWPIALAPTPGGPDESGCYSGCAVDDNGVPTIMYTGTRGTDNEVQTQCLATSHDGLRTWEKYTHNPVIAASPRNDRDFRDPFVWQQGDSWYCVIGSTMPPARGAALLYKSADLIHWDYLHPLLVGNTEQHGSVWECPNFFRLGDQYILLVSVIRHAGVYYFSGDYVNQHFIPRTEGWFHPNGICFAPLTMLDSNGRRLLWGWLREERSIEAQDAAGWAGVQSLPMVLTGVRQGKINVQPAPELQVLRQPEPLKVDSVTFSGNHRLDVTGDMLEIDARFSAADGVGLTVRLAPDGSEATHIYYEMGKLVIDRREACANNVDAVVCDLSTTELLLSPFEPLHLRVFVDHSVLEVYANGRAYMASRIYPSRTDSLGVALHSRAEAHLQALTVWQMRSIW